MHVRKCGVEVAWNGVLLFTFTDPFPIFQHTHFSHVVDLVQENNWLTNSIYSVCVMMSNTVFWDANVLYLVWFQRLIKQLELQ